MKKFLIAQAIFIVLAGAFVAAIDNHDKPGFQSIAAVLFWTFVVLMWAAIFVSSHNMIKVKDGDAKAIADARKFLAENPDRGIVRKTYGWIQSFVLVVLSAYSGMVVAAPLFLVASFLTKGIRTGYVEAIAKAEARKAAMDDDV